MHRHAPAALLAATLALLIGPAAASAAEDYLRPFEAVVDSGGAAELAAAGSTSSTPATTRGKSYNQTLAVDLLASPTPTGSSAAASRSRPSSSRRSRQGAARDRRRQSEPVLRRLPPVHGAGRHPRRDGPASPSRTRDVVKYERIGTSTLGKPILALKMTADARNVPDGARPAMLFSSNNHAREWIAAEVGRRLPGWFAGTRTTRRSRDLLARPSCGSCRSRTSTATTTRSPAASAPPGHLCDDRTEAPTQPLLAQDAARQQRQRHLRRQPGRRRPEPQLPGQARHRRGGRQQHFGSETYRGPYALSEPENLAFDRLLRGSLQGQHQLPLRRPAAADAGRYITDYAPPRRDDLQRDDRHRRRRRGRPVPAAALVGPVRVQRRHDRQRLHELRHHRLDAGDRHLRDRRRPVGLQPVRVPGRRGEGRGGLREEPAVRAQRRALAAATLGPPAQLRQRPEPVPDQGRPRTSSRTASTSPTAATQPIEANVRKDARPGRRHVDDLGAGGANRTVTRPR